MLYESISFFFDLATCFARPEEQIEKREKHHRIRNDLNIVRKLFRRSAVREILGKFQKNEAVNTERSIPEPSGN